MAKLFTFDPMPQADQDKPSAPTGNLVIDTKDVDMSTFSWDRSDRFDSPNKQDTYEVKWQGTQAGNLVFTLKQNVNTEEVVPTASRRHWMQLVADINRYRGYYGSLDAGRIEFGNYAVEGVSVSPEGDPVYPTGNEEGFGFVTMTITIKFIQIGGSLGISSS